MVLTISGLICLVGLLVYALTKNNPKVEEIGRIMFGVGLLCLLWNVGLAINILPTYRR